MGRGAFCACSLTWPSSEVGIWGRDAPSSCLVGATPVHRSTAPYPGRRLYSVQRLYSIAGVRPDIILANYIRFAVPGSLGLREHCSRDNLPLFRFLSATIRRILVLQGGRLESLMLMPLGSLLVEKISQISLRIL